MIRLFPLGNLAELWGDLVHGELTVEWRQNPN